MQTIGGKEVMLVSVRDITDRKRAEAKVRLQSAALAAVANAVVITDRQGQIIWVNRAFTELTGYTAREVVGKTPRILKSGRHDRAFYRCLWETILAGKVWQGQLINRRKDGRIYVDEQTITPLRDEEGEISHFIAIQQDVSEREKGKEILQQYAARLEALHDIDQAILNDQPAEVIAQITLDKIQQLIACPLAAVSVLDEATNEAVILACVGNKLTGFQPGDHWPLPSIDEIGVDLRQESFLVKNLTAEFSHIPLVERVIASGLRSGMHIPLHPSGEFLSMID